MPSDPADFNVPIPAEERTWAMLCHLSALGGYLVGGLTFLGPLIVWLIKKDEMRSVDVAGRESLNFQITMFIAVVVSGALMMVVIGCFLLPIVFLVGIIFPIIASVKTNAGEQYRYPFAIRIL